MVVQAAPEPRRAASAGATDRAVGGADRVRRLVTCSWSRCFNGGEQTWPPRCRCSSPTSCCRSLFGVAVLRYRLYDVEVIINRTVVLALGTAFAAVGYITLVVTRRLVVDSRTSGFWLSLLATALVALAFQPLRRRVVRLANRLAYGSRAQPYEALSDFSRRLAETPSPATLLPAVADAAGRAVSARCATRSWRRPGAAAISAQSGTCGPTPVPRRRAVRHGRDDLGSIRVWLPGGGDFGRPTYELLEALAEQAAVAFRNTALGGPAGRPCRRARPDHATSSPESRARIIEADDAARRTLEAADLARGPAPPGDAAPKSISGARAAIAAGQPATGSTRSSPAPTRHWRRCASSPAACSRPSSRGPGSSRRCGSLPGPERPRRRPSTCDPSMAGGGSRRRWRQPSTRAASSAVRECPS